MSIIHLCDGQRNMTFVVWDGEVTGGEWLKHVRELLADPDWPAINRFLVDLTTVSNTQSIRENVIREALAIFSENPALLAGKKNAIVARDEFRKAKRFEASVARFGTTTIVFNSLDTASIFLGIDVKEAHQVIERLRSRLRIADD